MTETQLGILFDDESSRGERHTYFGQSRYWMLSNDGSKRDDYFLANVNLSDDTIRAIDLTRRVWETDGEVPLAFIDNTGHGENRGLVLHAGFCQEAYFDWLKPFITSDLRTRVSVGAKMQGSRIHDFSRPTRIHVSVWGARQFFPKESGSPTDNQPIVEQVNYSLRWLMGDNGKWFFDDWSNPELWAPEDKQLVTKDKFNERRATYAVSIPEELNKEGSSEDVKDAEKIAEVIRRVGRKERAFPECPSMRLFPEGIGGEDEATRILQKYFQRRGVHFRIPIVGYSIVQNLLSHARLEDGRHLNNESLYEEHNRQTPREGIDFLFGPVLATIEKFVTS